MYERRQKSERREDATLLALRAEEGGRELRKTGGLWKPAKAGNRFSPEGTRLLTPWR